MKRSILILFVFLLSPVLKLLSQENNRTYLSLGISFTEYNQNFYREELPRSSLFIELNRSWNKKSEKSFSFVKELGLGLKYSNLSRESGGIAARTIYSLDYYHAIFSGSYLLQKKFSESFKIQFGPRVEGLIIGYEHGERTGWGWQQPDGQIVHYAGDKSFSEINRKYFDQLYYGPNLKILLLLDDSEKTIGFNYSFLFTKETDSNFETKSMMRFSFFVEL